MVGGAVEPVGGTVGVVDAPVVGVGVMPTTVVGDCGGLIVGAVGVAGTPVVEDVPAVLVGVTAAPVVRVALIATPLASVVTVIGSGLFSKPKQLSPFAP